jgi:hypothetical protein
MKGKYSSWGDFLKLKREAKFRSAREFCAKAPVGISYPQYSRYEAGDQLPSLEQALGLCRLLEVPPMEGLLEWSRSQVQIDGERKEVDHLLNRVRRGVRGEADPNESPETTLVSPVGAQVSSRVPLNLEEGKESVFDHLMVFNRSHIKLFQSDARFRDIFTFVNVYTPEEWIALDEVSRSLGIPAEELEPMVETMNDHGLILLAGGKCRSPKVMYYFPDDEDFFELRNQNYTYNANAILANANFDNIRERSAYRNVLTRRFTQSQVQHLVGRLDEILREMANMPEEGNTVNDPVYSVCLLAGERFRRIERAAGVDSGRPGLRTGLLSPNVEGAAENSAMLAQAGARKS